MILVCERCGRLMKCDKVGVIAIEMRKEGKLNDTNGKEVPYKAWSTDRYKCPECGYGILIRSPNQGALAHEYQTDEMETYINQNECQFI